MNMLIAKALSVHPMDTHIILGKEEGHPESNAYFTRAGGYSPEGRWYEGNGHYMMDILEATKDFTDRVKRGY